MRRRAFLGNSLGLSLAAALKIPVAAAASAARVRPGTARWPSDADWSSLKAAVGGRLSPVDMPDLADPATRALLTNPFYLADQPALNQSSGWLDAWRAAPSRHVVAAEGAADVAAAVKFARAHDLRLVIKGRGHSYLGQSNAPDSLLVWTRHMDDVTVHDAFTPQGSSAAPVHAVSCGAGAMWLHAYQAVSVQAGRYVQGGGCTTVGVAGLVQGGGFGSFSKGFGTAAASLLEAEIVTADGQIRVVNHAQEPDLYWALKGGGGGTFGVITRLTLATHELPQTFGGVILTIQARSDDAFHRLLAAFVSFYADHLCNPNWGEQVHATPSNTLIVSMEFHGMGKEDASALWQGLIDFANAHRDDYSGQDGFRVFALPARMIWNADVLRHVPGVIASDERSGANPTDFWNAGDAEQVGVFWHAYTSAWMPATLLAPKKQAALADAWFAASRQWDVAFHFNKGLAGAPPAALAASRDTATNPDVLSAFALAIIADAGPSLYADPKPDESDARERAGRVQASMKALRAAAPNAGAYVNECDYFQPDWQKAFWGPNYSRLLGIKRRYDPDGLFTVHHGVGSEGWSADGFTRT